MIIVGAVALIITYVTPGVLGHVFALIGWGIVAWICLRPARSGVKSAARTWARIGVAASAVFAVYAGGLAVAGSGNGSGGCYVTVDNVITVQTTDTGTVCTDVLNSVQNATDSATLGTEVVQTPAAVSGSVGCSGKYNDSGTVYPFSVIYKPGISDVTGVGQMICTSLNYTGPGS